jgi:hypothetical protein
MKRNTLVTGSPHPELCGRLIEGSGPEGPIDEGHSGAKKRQPSGGTVRVSVRGIP